MQKYDPAKHHRRSIRLPGHDYSAAGAYFVTICVNHRHRLLGKVRQGVMVPSAAGEMVQRVWQELPLHYAGVDIDAFVGLLSTFGDPLSEWDRPLKFLKESGITQVFVTRSRSLETRKLAT